MSKDKNQFNVRQCEIKVKEEELVEYQQRNMKTHQVFGWKNRIRLMCDKL